MSTHHEQHAAPVDGPAPVDEPDALVEPDAPAGTDTSAAGGPPDEAEMEELVRLAQQCLEMARAGDTETLAGYVDAGVPVDLTAADGNTLLMLAAYHGHAATVAALAERGADVDRLNDRGQSPLAGAVFKGEAEVVEVLLRHGADPDHGTPTARESAALFGQQHLLDPGTGGEARHG